MLLVFSVSIVCVYCIAKRLNSKRIAYEYNSKVKAQEYYDDFKRRNIKLKVTTGLTQACTQTYLMD